MIIAEAITPADMQAVRQVRHDVFIVEQSVPAELEWDGLDAQARHLLARDGDVAAGTLRWRRLDEIAKVERVCVARSHRGTGWGRS